MAESDSSRDSSSITDDESVYSYSESFSSGMSDVYDGIEVLPYRFEPESSPSSPPDESRTRIPSDMEEAAHSRIGNIDWCTCGHCVAMNTEMESICCNEVQELKQLLDDTESRPQCITQHADFNNVCLCRAVLTVSLYSHRHRYGTSDIPTDENRRFRYLSYRQLVWWGWQYLGRHRRVVLPSCAVSKIRTEFPSHEYTGYQDAPATP